MKTRLAKAPVPEDDLIARRHVRRDNTGKLLRCAGAGGPEQRVDLLRGNGSKHASLPLRRLDRPIAVADDNAAADGRRFRVG